MTILFMAASNKNGGAFDYNAYSISAVTGHDLQQIAAFTGMSGDVQPSPDGKSATVISGDDIYIVDLKTHATKQVSLSAK